MKNIRKLALVITPLILLSLVAFAQSRKTITSKGKETPVAKPTVNPKPPQKAPVNQTPMSEFKVLIEGQQSKVETPFVFVARDAETYALIRSMVEGLPAGTTVDFSRSAVVAAFAGEKNTGGYSVNVRQSPPNKIVVDLRAPQKGAMTAQVISYPFQVVQVPVGQLQALSLELTPTWASRMKTYRVSKGDFQYSGGFRGIHKKFDAEGTVDVMNFGEHVTYNFNLSGKGKDSAMKLSETASGVVKNGSVEIARLDAGTFAEFPNPPLKVYGMVGDEKLSLIFEPHPPTVADGFAARGTLEAVKIK